MRCFCVKDCENTKNLKGQIKFKQYLILCTIFSKSFHEILNLNRRTEIKRFPLIILHRILLNCGTKSGTKSKTPANFGSLAMDSLTKSM